MLDTAKIKQRFYTLNAERLNRTRKTLRENQRRVIDIIPLLFHTNDEKFPGFISADTPVGIAQYTVSKDAVKAGKALFRGFNYKRRALRGFDIHALFMIGSCGTMAFSSSSDFDIWLCHRPDLDEVGKFRLQEKAALIEQWAETFDLEVHFFLMDTDSFKAGLDIELSDESSGSAQHHLLLEEFYRTALLYAGRCPLWWFVPAEVESRGEYEAYARKLIKTKIVAEHEVIDFGGMPKSLAQEFFGAAVWHLYKAISSPYKSVLKLILMEVYGNEFPNTELLCLQYKKAIHEGASSLIELDPYIMLYRKIEQYLLKTNDHERLEVVRRSFYYKVNKPLSKKESRHIDDWGREVLQDLVTSWEWDDLISLIDERPHWKIDMVQQETRTIIASLQKSYQFLSAMAREHNQLMKISQRDLNILGRKLYIAFERKPGKIDNANPGISKDVHESNVTIAEQPNGKSWVLLRGNAATAHEKKPLKTTVSLSELIVWCYFNRIINEQTAISLILPHEKNITANEIKAMIKCLIVSFNSTKEDETNVNALEKPAINKNFVIFINVNEEVLLSFAREGKHLTTNRIDSLSYSGMSENLLSRIDMVSKNTWKEVYVTKYNGETAILECLRDYFGNLNENKDKNAQDVAIYCFSSGHGPIIRDRITLLFKEISNCFLANKDQPDRPLDQEYILHIKTNFYALYFDKGILNYRLIGGQNELMQQLTNAKWTKPLVFDSLALNETPIPAAYQHHKAGAIQVFVEQRRSKQNIYLIDEKGTLFIREHQESDPRHVINQYRQFISGLWLDKNDQALYPTYFYHIKRDDYGQWQSNRDIHSSSLPQKTHHSIHVICDSDDAGKPAFILSVGEKQYNAQTNNMNIYDQIAHDILSLRTNAQPYPAYVTSLEFSSKLKEKESLDYLQTSHYMKYKTLIEDRIQRSIEKLSIKQQRSQVVS